MTTPSATAMPPPAVRARAAAAEPGTARLAPLPQQPARLREPDPLRGAVRPEPARRSALQRQAAGRALRGAVVLPGRADAARDDLRRRFPDADRLSRSAHPREPGASRAISRCSRPIPITTARSTTSPRSRIPAPPDARQPARHRRPRARSAGAAAVRLSRLGGVRADRHRDVHDLRRALRRDPGLFRRLDRHRAWSASTRSGARCRRSTC